MGDEVGLGNKPLKNTLERLPMSIILQRLASQNLTPNRKKNNKRLVQRDEMKKKMFVFNSDHDSNKPSRDISIETNYPEEIDEYMNNKNDNKDKLKNKSDRNEKLDNISKLKRFMSDW